MNLLDSLDIVKKGKQKATIGIASQSYYLTNYALSFDIVQVGVKSKAIAKTIKKVFKNKTKPFLSHPIHGKQINNLTQLKISDNEKIVLPWKSDDQESYYNWAHTNLVRFSEYTTTDEFYTDANFTYSLSDYGRTYHFCTSLPKLYRYKLRHISGLPITELDLISAQPLLIALAYQEFLIHMFNKYGYREGDMLNISDLYRIKSKTLEGFEGLIKLSKEDLILYNKNSVSTFHYNDEICKEVPMSQVLIDCLSGKFYDVIQKHIAIMDDEELVAKYGDLSRDEIKLKIIADAFYSNQWFKTKEFLEIVSNKYPDFVKYITYFKDCHGYKKLSQQGQSREANIFIDGVYSEIGDKFAVSVHDSILVKSEEVDYFNRVLVGLMQKNHPFVNPELFENVIKPTYYGGV
jgi:hypothetical protein